MNRRELLERLAAEIQSASADGDGDRARKLAMLQAEVVARIGRDTIAEQACDGSAVPEPRQVPQQERTDWLGERHEINLLRWHWGAFYEIARASQWTARRRDDGLLLAAPSAGGLRHLIHCDFAARPVPRQLRH
jgi:hypothetical protein